jgi:mannose-6-phosphate isomerase-like protein (cupin superfamily)
MQGIGNRAAIATDDGTSHAYLRIVMPDGVHLDMDKSTPRATGRFDIHEVAASLPETATTLLVDRYLTDKPSASTRVFRVYKPTPPHYHVNSDEYLYVISGRGTFWMQDPASVAEFKPGQLLFFERGTVHALPDILAEPLVFLSIDAPRRDPKDIVFIDPSDGTPEDFIQQSPTR